MDQLSLKKVKIRKPHKCWGCAEEFPEGTELTKSVSVDQGEFSSTYWCSECEEFMSTLDYWQLEDGFAMGGLMELKKEISNA